MGHALVPSVFQRTAEGILRAVQRRTGIHFIAYLDDWLLWGTREEIRAACLQITNFGVTINNEKSVLTPCTSLTYLGFKINSVDMTIKLLLSTYDKLTHLLRFVKNGSTKDRQKIHGYNSWILYNLRLPAFLAKDILRGDASWLQAALKDLSILDPKELLDPPATMNLYTDATPWSIAAVLPSMTAHFAQAFEKETEINRAELIAGIQGLLWAAGL